MRRLVALAALAALSAHAGRPLTTEDASYLQDKACQLEAWIDRSRVETLAWAVPACNFGLGIEWQAGFARSRSGGESRLAESYVQGKSAWKVADGPWSVGLVAGIARHNAQETARGWENPYVTVPLSVAVGDSGAIHANVGWARERAAGRDLATWGLAAESFVTHRVTLLAEAFGDNRGNPYLRFGGRFGAIRDRLDLDLSIVTRAHPGRADKLVSLGFFVQTGRFLP